jgi:molybdopterin converting factor small subunit
LVCGGGHPLRLDFAGFVGRSFWVVVRRQEIRSNRDEVHFVCCVVDCGNQITFAMMQVQLMSYGALTDITGSEVFELEIPQQALTVAEMKLLLLARYPALEGKTFRMAVNERFVGDDFEVLSGVKIALMPPFSGG